MRTSKIDTTVVGSPLPPVLTGIASLIIPGLGQVFSNQARRGLLMLASLGTMVGILITRIYAIGVEYFVDGFWPAAAKALERYTAFSVVMVLSLGFLYLWIAYDAYRLAKDKKKQKNFGFWVVLLGFFTLGYQLSEINLVRMVQNFPDASRRMARVMWPWEAAFEYDEERVEADALIRVSAEGELPPVPQREDGEPYISIEPRFGTLGQVDEQYNQVPGTEITVTGSGFTPNTFTEIYWVDDAATEFRPRTDGSYVSVTTDADGNFQLTMDLPFDDTPSGRTGTIYNEVIARQSFEVGNARFSNELNLILELMLETIFMGMMATIFGIVFSIPVSFLAARNIMGGTKLGLAVYYLTRTILNIIRSIEPLIWAVIAVVWVGIGTPFAGIIALTIHSIAALGKLYSEAIESIDHGPIEAIQATGANQLQTIMFAIIPQMISPFVSFSIYRWDINVRMSTIIGMVGGGGVGFIVVQFIRLGLYQEAGIAVWFIAMTVALLDYVSAEIRNRFV